MYDDVKDSVRSKSEILLTDEMLSFVCSYVKAGQ